MEDGHIIYDARQVNSAACYQDWVATRGSLPADPEKTFQRSLTAHVTGSDGRQPFSADEEEAILRVLRIKQKWPAFERAFAGF